MLDRPFNNLIFGSSTSELRKLNFRKLTFVFGVLWLGLPFLVSAAGATLSINPYGGEFSTGSTVSVVIRIHSGGNAINAAESTLNFPPEFLRAVSVSKTGSIFSFWPIEPTIDNQKGIIQFAGGSPSSFSGSNGTVLIITFSIKKIGEASLNFSGSRILLADGSGTDVFASAQGAAWKLVTVRALPKVETPKIPHAPEISSPSHPDPNKWYAKDHISFEWQLTSDTKGVSIGLDQNVTSDPGPLSDGLMEKKTYDKVKSGEWYFHIKFRNEFGWGGVTHRRVLIDTEPPESFSVFFPEGKEVATPQPLINFRTTDRLSGISHYEIKIGDGDFYTAPVELAHNPYRLPIQMPGKRKLILKAFDNAGNERVAPEEEFTVLPSPELFLPAPRFLPTLLNIILGALTLLFLGAVLYVSYQLLLTKKKLRKETREATDALHRAFDLLRESVRDQIKTLEKARSRRQLTLEEEKVIKGLKENLDDAEKFIKKEIEDIEREL